jgi:hypothetical protein
LDELQLTGSSDDCMTGFSADLSGIVTTPSKRLYFQTRANGADAVMRVVGCMLVSMMPQEGLQEALADLQGVFEFYSPGPTPQIKGMTIGPPVAGRPIAVVGGTASPR